MVKRRKMLIGMGALAAGSGAAFATGATDSVQADRSLEVDVKGDAGAAYLGLDANDDSAFVNNNSPLSLNFGADSGFGGSGINDDGSLYVWPAFTLENQHSETLYVEANNPAANSDITGGGVDVQLLAIENASGGITNTCGAYGKYGFPAALFDRTTTVQGFGYGNSQSNEIKSNTDPSFILTNPGAMNKPSKMRDFYGSQQACATNGSAPHYLELGPGEACDVIVRVIANEAGTGDMENLDGTIEFEAFDDSSQTTLSNAFTFGGE
jgi:hypothetical protein